MEEFRKMSSLDLSTGQRRRLQVAREFIHDMDLLFLDEPTVGLDPIVRRNALNYFKERVQDGLSIFFTTHILEEAEYLCDRIAVINRGRVVEIDTPANLKRKFGNAKEVEFKFLEGTSADFQQSLSRHNDVASVELDPTSGAYRAKTSKPEVVIPEIYRTAERLGLHVSSVYIAETTLEDAFISMIEGSGGEAKAS
jgi:ABC-2 type transport system ATP-binding protein